MTTFTGELIMLTPLKQDNDHYIVKIHREENAIAEKILHIAGGPYAGIIVNRLEENPNLDFHPDVSLSFNVLLGNRQEKPVQEKRSLYFFIRHGVDADVGRAVVHKYFRSLLSNLSGGYVSFMKKAIGLLQKEFLEITALVIDYKLVAEEEQVAIPDAAQYDSGSEIEEVTAGHVQEVLEHAYPDGLPVAKIAECLRCDEDEVIGYLSELESSRIVTQVGDEWIRADTKKVYESIEAQRQASASTSADQPTVAIISCLFVEKQAVDSLIEESSTIHKYKSGGDSNVYTIGRIGEHRVVATKLALIGDSREAITSAGSITTRLLGNFQNIEHVFIVGVGGAVPHFTDASLHARLGDVIVSASRPHGYVYAHDLLLDRKTDNVTGFAVRNWDAADKTIERIVEKGIESGELISDWNKSTNQAIKLLEATAGSADVEWKSPPESTDVLAMTISKGNVVVMPHPNLDRKGPEIHIGSVGAMASMKKYEAIVNEEDSINQLRESFVESFGIRCMDAGFDSVVGAIVGSCVKSWALIRGISDYQQGQSRASKQWQAHAAARAAGITRCIIEKLPV
ncbi:unnamed protein product [Caenorhabditis bovis]|uniref:Winged helix-turn-helix domain-containing protein n=1 Tax=Caenorhabditis bovis TaxID=2654633 RepID=A0A8S1ENN3_9PELO|nr:unnamed protein product [Caenorhabditis bovis]